MDIKHYSPEGELEHKKQNLWRLFLLSAGIDIFSTAGVFASFGLGVIIEELIENAVSRMIANYGNITLTTFDHWAGALPIPGVTAVTVHCGRKLLNIYVQEKLTATE